MPRRTTVKLRNLIDDVNGRILHTPDDMRAERLALASLLETQLMNAGVYSGYCYLTDRDMNKSKNGKSVGAIMDETGKVTEIPDDSRRAYFYGRHLHKG